MRLHVIASGSDQNAYVLDAPVGQLLLECGVRYPRIQQALDFDLSRLAGCLVTHEHQDHARAVQDVCKAGIDVYMSAGTADALALRSHRLHTVEARKLFGVGGFDIMPFDTQHDAAEPLGWLIRERKTGHKLVFATDTYYIRHRFAGIKAFAIECNHCRDILGDNVAADIVHPARVKRLRTSHFELSNCVKFLDISADKTTDKVVLLHLSKQNSDPTRMIAECGRAARCQAVVAEAGAVIDLCDPF